MGTIRRQLEERPWLASALYGLLLLAMMVPLLESFYFPSDELEIFAKGQAVAKGQLLYAEVGSQHMPLMYYIAAFFSLIGVSSAPMFRLCFYALFALMWTIVFHRYSRWFGRLAVGLYPPLYIALITQIGSAWCILSEHLQGIGMVILLYELLRFYDTRKLPPAGCAMVGVAVFISFGSAFVSAFAIFAVWLTVFVLEIGDARRRGDGPLRFVGYLAKKYWLLVVCLVVPFAVLVGYYALTGSLGDFVGWAYTCNRAIYPRYLGGGYGSGILSSMFNGVSLIGGNLALSGGLTFVSLLACAFALVALASLVDLARRTHSAVLVLGVTFLLVTSATRGTFNFHGLPYVALVSALSTKLVGDNWPELRSWADASSLRTTCVVVVALVCLSGYIRILPDGLSVSLASDTKVEGSGGWAIDQITEDGEEIGFSSFDNSLLLDSGTTYASVTAGSTPWMWEWGGEQAMEELRANPPRVFVFSEGWRVWEDYAITEYAPDLTAFVRDNYISLDSVGYPGIWVRNDYYEEALGILGIDLFLPSTGARGSNVELSDGKTATRTLTVPEGGELWRVRVRAQSSGEEAAGDLVVSIVDTTTGARTEIGSAAVSSFSGGSYVDLTMKNHAQLEEGVVYRLEASVSGLADGDVLRIGCDTLNDAQTHEADLDVSLFRA